MDTHEHYEMLTALAMTGQLSDSELSDLLEHAINCAPCLQSTAEMEDVSQKLFLAQAGSSGPVSSPAGMQRRFQERARSAGIPLSSPVALTFSRAFLRPVLATLLLTAFATLSWKLLVAPRIQERASVASDDPAQRIASLHPDHGRPLVNHHLASTLPQIRQRVKRKAVAQRDPVAASSIGNSAGSSQSSFALSRPSFARHDYARVFLDSTSIVPLPVNQNYMTSGLHLHERMAFEPSSGPGLWGATDGERSGQRTFHYNPDLAALSFLDGPQASGSPTFSLENMSRSQFHLNKTW